MNLKEVAVAQFAVLFGIIVDRQVKTARKPQSELLVFRRRFGPDITRRQARNFTIFRFIIIIIIIIVVVISSSSS